VKIAIVGASGKMGGWFAALLHQHGHELLLVGRRPEPLEQLARTMDGAVVGTNADVGSADLVIISVPLHAVDAVMRDLAPHVRPSQAVIDLSSLKTAPQRAAEAYLPHARFLGVHPMFGSGAESFAGHNVILTPAGEAAAALAEKVRRYVEPLGAHVVTMDPRTHDEVMAIVLGLPPLVVAAVARTALASGCFEAARDVSGTSLEVLMSLTESMLCEGSELYGTLLASLPSAPSIATALQQSAEHFARLVSQGDRSALIEEFASLGSQLEQLDHRASNAYARMYAMLEALKRFPSTAGAGPAEASPPPREAC
jgi:prephenate dehydrogenase